MSRQLERHGYVVATAKNGRQALEMLQVDTFDLVLLDVVMPDMDGYEVLKHLKADEALCHIPVIMISALSELDAAVRCIGWERRIPAQSVHPDSYSKRASAAAYKPSFVWTISKRWFESALLR